MAFRRRRSFTRRGPRGRRRLPETYTWLECSNCINIFQDAPCISPVIDSFTLLNMKVPANPGDLTQVSNPSDKFVVFDGMKFQSEWSLDPAEAQDAVADPPPSQLAFHVHIWEAIVLAPTTQGARDVPAYIPVLTAAAFQTGDLADRVLWKRISSLPWWGLQVGSGFPQLVATNFAGVGEDRHAMVKARCRVDDRHNLLYVINITHNVVIGSPQGPCDTPGTASIPLRHNFWAKMFYHTRK